MRFSATEPPPFEARRRLGTTSAAALVVANMIGVGAFTTSGFALRDLGQPAAVLVAWLVGGVLALCGALSYGALARRLPESGGEYTFLARTIDPVAGILAGWVSVLAGFTAPIAAAALALPEYLADSTGIRLHPGWLATGTIFAAAAMHGLRFHAGVVLQNAAVLLKLVVISMLVTLGAVHVRTNVDVAQFRVRDVDPGAFAVTLVWISFAYSGWNAATYVAGEIRDPARSLPRALWSATFVVMVLYLALNAVVLYAAPVEALAGRVDVAAVAAEALGGPWLRRTVSGLVALALFTSISSMFMAGARIYARMAEDGVLPRVVAAGRDAPSAAVAVQTALALLAIWISGLPQLLSCAGFTLGLCAAATVAGLIVLRWREGPRRVPVPGYPWVPALFVLGTLGASTFMVLREPQTALVGMFIAVTGVPIYWLTFLNQGRDEYGGRHEV